MSVAKHEPRGFRQAIWAELRRPVPLDRGWLPGLGWVCTALLVVAGLTGSLLSIYYLPAEEAAAESVRYISREVEWGWLVRGIHHWSSNLLVAGAVLLGLRVFLLGRYRGELRASWVLGTVLFMVVLGMAFTGELLPWDADSVALASSALAGTEAVPLVGAPAAAMMRGDPEVGVATLARAHAAHTLVLPWLAFVLLVVQLWFRGRMRRTARRLKEGASS